METAELEQAQRRVQAVLAEMTQAEPNMAASQVALDNAKKEQERVGHLVSNGALPTRDADSASLATRQAEANVASVRARSKVLSAELSQARAAVRSVRARLERKNSEAQAQTANINQAESRSAQAEHVLTQSQITSPIDGVVLERFETGPKELLAGTPLLTLGNFDDLEAICDVLSQDALRVKIGTRVFFDAGGALPDPVLGEVRQIEPKGFTKRSSLGVEQQRVRVHVSLLSPPEGIGIGYELWARFQITEKLALSLPRSCFVRRGEGYQIWRVRPDETLELVDVEVGIRSDTMWELLSLIHI